MQGGASAVVNSNSSVALHNVISSSSSSSARKARFVPMQMEEEEELIVIEDPLPKDEGVGETNFVYFFSRLRWPSALIMTIIICAAHFGRESHPGNWEFTMYNQYNYDFRNKMDQIVPPNMLGVFALVLAIVIVVTEFLLVRRAERRQHWLFIGNLVLGMIEALVFAVAMTEMAKYWISEPRPDFRDRCLGTLNNTLVPPHTPDGIIICTNPDKAEVDEGRLAFPSGHSSFCGAVGMYTTLYLMWLAYLRPIHLPWRGKQIAKRVQCRLLTDALFVVCIIPWVAGLGIAASRIVDHWHSPADVTAGVVIGTCAGALTFMKVMSAVPE